MDIDSHFTKAGLLIETLTEEIMTSVLRETEFDYPDES